MKSLISKWPSLEEQLENYQPSSTRQQEIKNKFINLLSEGSIAFTRDNINRHFTGSGLLFNQEQNKILLTHHKKLAKWLQLGGHCDGDESALHTAFIECQEESGIQDLSIISPNIFDLDIHLIPQYNDIKAHYHYDVRYLIKANCSEDTISTSDESLDLKWYDLNTIINSKNIDKAVQDLVRKFLATEHLPTT